MAILYDFVQVTNVEIKRKNEYKYYDSKTFYPFF